ncbi:hypothetical protein L873DRAFT_1812818 [Choiromyces venosus 120613-1]|uniref:C2H2-type domain-containing protein n=1 Tax=Choiromyces venosus 120613-1 TaxID=1336337 RepID=A0A3N4JB36_9PEZI|nr:hypothetical protein L873DRAFT_1812818 [Choiromyces venosus 120613-1]
MNSEAAQRQSQSIDEYDNHQVSVTHPLSGENKSQYISPSDLDSWNIEPSRTQNRSNTGSRIGEMSCVAKHGPNGRKAPGADKSTSQVVKGGCKPKKFPCKLGCKESFGRTTDEARHRKTAAIHGGNGTPWKCQMCQTRFNRFDNLRQHFKRQPTKCRKVWLSLLSTAHDGSQNSQDSW